MDKNVIPLYYRIYNEIRNRILSGYYKDGKLPTEMELCTEFGASRITIRNALEQLRREGLISRSKGLGTFIKKFESEEQLTKLTGFTDEMKDRKVTSKVLENRLVNIPAEAQDCFGLAPGTLVVLLKRVRYIDDKPIAIESAYLNPSVDLRLLNILQKDMEKESLYHFIQNELSINLAYAEEILEVTKVSKDEANLLDVKPGECAILRKRFTYTDTQKCIEYVLSIYRGDEYKFKVVRK
ncbi:MAG: GntR family transcriptional regulator [Fervidobacterium sp.]|uniref:GntR family transcriptional regulator n=1 Tax=Fervidobacterium sp. TaxID=1871331 RepID=UPI00404AFFC2